MVTEAKIYEGLKKTEFGFIPKDWIEDKLENVIDVLTDFTANGSFASLAQNVKYLDKPDYARLVRLTDIRASFKNEAIYISREAYNFLFKSKLQGNELLLANVGAYAGYTFLYPEGLPFKGSLGPNMFLIKFKENIFIPKYAYYSFISKILLQQLLSKAASSAQPKLNKQNVRECFVCYPPTKKEQVAIATALNDTDKLISQLEKLIAKKQLIKQGAISEILTGKKRLNGFKDNWIKKPFSEVCWFQEGPGLRNWQFTNSGMKVINVTNLEDGFLYLESTDRYISLELFNTMYRHFAIDENDIVVASSGNSYAKVAVVRKKDLPLVMNTSVIRFKPLKGLHYEFLLAFLKSNLFKDQIDLLITGGAQPNFGPYHLNKVVIEIPPTLEEQSVIGNILMDIDSELLTLKTKLEKYKLLKQGMMQNLLTGKIRLV